jgi:hypothetical protein
MTFGAIVNAAIGLMLVYLLLSLVVTAVQEAIASFAQKRGKALEAGLQEMLSTVDAATGGRTTQLFSDVFNHALIQAGSGSRRPSYIAARNFSSALLDVLTRGSASPAIVAVKNTVAALPAGKTQDTLLALVTEAGGDMDKLRARVESWFDDAMDRVSGSFKRHTQRWVIALGIIIAITMNVNSIEIAATIASSSTAQDALATLETKLASQPADKLTAADANDLLAKLPVPIGWTGTTTTAAKVLQAYNDRKWPAGMTWFTVLTLALGWLITGMAISLGAPFWFDMLQNFVNIRGAGEVPKKADGSA